MTKKIVAIDDAPDAEFVEIINDPFFYDETYYEQLEAKINGAKEAVKRKWLESDDPRPWAVAWSGGKDSTATLKLVTEAILELSSEQQRIRPIRVVTSDTRMENPLIEAYLHDQSAKFNVWAKSLGLDWTSTIVSRPLHRGFFYLILGKGYPIPGNTGRRRWCTHALKIEPNEKFYKDVNPSLVIVGTRNMESARRDNVMNKYRTDDIYFQTSDKGYLVMTPVIEFTVEDIWTYLAMDTPWSSTEAVKTLYKDATGECGFRNPRGANDPGETSMVKACGARFGCWTCPPIDNDKSTEKMSETRRWMVPLTRWRELLKKTYGVWNPPTIPLKGLKGEERKKAQEYNKQIKAQAAEENRRQRLLNKSGYRRNPDANGNPVYLKPGDGTLRISARKMLFEELMKTQDEVNLLRALEGLDPIELIHQDEIDAIKRQWKEDEEKRPWLL